MNRIHVIFRCHKLVFAIKPFDVSTEENRAQLAINFFLLDFQY